MNVHPTIAAQLAALHVNDMREQAARARRAREARRARRGFYAASGPVVLTVATSNGQRPALPCAA